jgi:hypothetical protein
MGEVGDEFPLQVWRLVDRRRYRRAAAEPAPGGHGSVTDGDLTHQALARELGVSRDTAEAAMDVPPPGPYASPVPCGRFVRSERYGPMEDRSRQSVAGR